MHKLPCNLHALTLAYGQLVVFYIAECYKFEFFQELPCPVAPFFARHTPHKAIQLKCTVYSQVSLKARLLQYDSHPLSNFAGVLYNVLAEDLHHPRSWIDKRSEHSYRSSLACAVWAKKAKYLTIFYIK